MTVDLRRHDHGPLQDCHPACPEQERLARVRRNNLALFKHEAETRDHDANGECCRAAVRDLTGEAPSGVSTGSQTP